MNLVYQFVTPMPKSDFDVALCFWLQFEWFLIIQCKALIMCINAPLSRFGTNYKQRFQMNYSMQHSMYQCMLQRSPLNLLIF